MEDKPLDLSKKSVTSNRESQFPSSDEQQETEKEDKQRTSNYGIFPQEEETSISGEKKLANKQENVKFVSLHHRNNANETDLSQDVIPGNSVRTKRKIITGPEINSVAKRYKDVEYPSNPYIKSETRVLADHDYSDKATRDCSCHEPSTSAGPNCSLHFSGIEGLSTRSSHGEKYFAYVRRDRICFSPADLKLSGMYTGERPTGRKVKDTPRVSVSDCSGRATSEISRWPLTSAPVNCSYDSAEVQGYSPIIHNRTPTGEMHVRYNTGEEPLTCQLCDKRYYSIRSLARHSRLHTGERLSKCEYCNKTCVTEVDLKLHTKMHNKERPFVCQECNKRFATKGNFNQHMRTHTKAKPYKCTICDKSFSHNPHLNRHLIIHSKEKPYECTICNKSFSYKSYLNKHLKVHTKEKPYKCQICGRWFSRKDLDYHKKTHKKNQTE